MKLLLDTHSFIWFTNGDTQLSDSARTLIAAFTNEVFLSIVSIWETAIKVSIGKLVFNQGFDNFVPIDRVLIARSLVEAIPLVSRDVIFGLIEY